MTVTLIDDCDSHVHVMLFMFPVCKYESIHSLPKGWLDTSDYATCWLRPVFCPVFYPVLCPVHSARYFTRYCVRYSKCHTPRSGQSAWNVRKTLRLQSLDRPWQLATFCYKLFIFIWGIIYLYRDALILCVYIIFIFCACILFLYFIRVHIIFTGCEWQWTFCI
jgi:hypothetical protein